MGRPVRVHVLDGYPRFCPFQFLLARTEGEAIPQIKTEPPFSQESVEEGNDFRGFHGEATLQSGIIITDTK